MVPMSSAPVPFVCAVAWTPFSSFRSAMRLGMAQPDPGPFRRLLAG